MLNSVDPRAHVQLTSGTGYLAGLHMAGLSGNVDVTVSQEGSGPNVTVTDEESYSSVLGRSDLVQTNTGKKEQTPAASLVLFGKDKKVLWSAP